MLKRAFLFRYKLQIQFVVFEMEDTYDFVYAYIRASVNDKFVRKYTGTTKVIIYNPPYPTAHKITIIHLSLSNIL